MDIGKYLVKGEMDKEIENELNVIVQRKMIPFVLLKESLLSMKTSGKEFKVKFTMYVMGKFFNPTMHYSSKRSWVPVLRNVDAVKDMNWPKYGVHELIAGIRKTVMEKQSSVRGCVGLLAVCDQSYIYVYLY